MKMEDKKGQRFLGSMIRELRVFNGWTQNELAQRLRNCGFERCKRPLLSQIESGIAAIRGHEVYHLREVFGPDFEQTFWKPYYSHVRTNTRSEL